MVSAAACVREANISNNSVSDAISLLAGSSKMRRMSLPIGVPPGSWFGVTRWPSCSSLACSNRSWVDFPLPSVPSNVMNSPVGFGSLEDSVIDEMEQSFQIFPGFTARCLIVLAKEIRRMIRNHHGNAVPCLPVAAKFRDAFFGIEKRFHRCRPERANRFRLDGHELTEQELPAGLHLVRKGRAVLRRSALHDVADVDIRACNRNTFFGGGIVDHLSQQLSRAADKRQS